MINTSWSLAKYLDMQIRERKLMTNRILLTPFFLDEHLPGLERLHEKDWILNKPELPQDEVQVRMSVLHEKVAAHVVSSLESGDRPVSIAGDCCVTIGVAAGIQRANLDPLLVWFDAHGDFNTRETSPSGFLGGMPLAMLVGRGDQSMLEAQAMRPHSEERVVFTDGRDLDSLEREALERSKVVHLKDVDDLLTYNLPDLPVHVHFDTDILNPETAPGMNYLAPGGPDLEQLKVIFRHLADTSRIVAVSLSSWNPALDLDGLTQRACMEALEVLLKDQPG
jgi:arginase